MRDPAELYTIDEAAAAELDERTRRAGSGPTMLHMVRGFVDAGNAGPLQLGQQGGIEPVSNEDASLPAPQDPGILRNQAKCRRRVGR